MISPSSCRYFLYARKSTESEDRQVASIPSQIDELKKVAQKNNLKIIDILTEEKSAKAPGRPVFTKMVADIRAGKADGIICWKLDRLARNPIDGGTISWMLQRSLVKHIQTYERSYYTSDNVLMMNLEFGMANQYIIDLSTNVKRGQRNKVQNGWYPHKPTLGYLNNRYNQPELPPIYKDDETFPIIKELFRMLLEKRCSLEQLLIYAKEMGLKTRGGKIISRATFFNLFRNPFYYGSFLWKGEVYPGKHEPMITREEFDLAQSIIDGRSNPCVKRHIFAFKGLIRCGECGASITAEEKFKHQKNGNVHHYKYYRCTKRINPKCSQMPIREDALEQQIIEILDKIHIPASFHQWAIKYLKEEQKKEIDDRENISISQHKRLNKINRKIDVLVNMRLEEEISAEKYSHKKEELINEQKKLEELLSDANNRSRNWLSHAEELLSFAVTAKERFEIGSAEDKRQILSCLGSNLQLLDRELRILVVEPLRIMSDLAPEVRLLHNRIEEKLEPLQHVDIKGVYEKNYAKNVKWRG